MHTKSSFGLLFTILLATSNLAFAQSGFFNSELVFQDEDHHSVKMADFLGKRVVATMSYSECKKTCPLVTMTALRKIQKKLDEQNKTAEFVILSFDSKNDTSEVWKKYRAKQKIESPHWHFLTGTEHDTRIIAKQLGLDRYWTMDDHILHDFKVTLFSESGEQIERLDWDHREVASFFP